MTYRLIKVKVKPNGKKDYIEKLKEDEYFVETKAPAENNKANESVKNILSNYLKVEEKNIVIIKGHRLKSKVFKVF